MNKFWFSFLVNIVVVSQLKSLRNITVALYFSLSLLFAASYALADATTEADDIARDTSTVSSPAENTPSQPEAHTDKPATPADEPDIPLFNYLDVHQRDVSSYLQRFVNSIDNFFTNSEAVDQSTGSYLRITTEAFWPEGSGMTTKGGISLRIRLPRTQKKLKLVFESDVDQKRDIVDRETSDTGSTEDSGDDASYYTGIEGELNPLKQWNIRPSLGIRLRSPLDYYARIKANRQSSFQKWVLYLDDTLYWFDSIGFGNDIGMRWDRPLDDDLLFRSHSFARYLYDNDEFELSQTFSLVHTLSQKRAITYKIGAFGRSQPTTHATDYLISALYRNNFHSDYLFLDIQPQIVFRDTNRFHGVAELLIRLEFYYRD